MLIQTAALSMQSFHDKPLAAIFARRQSPQEAITAKLRKHMRCKDLGRH
jgi:hypothetical protein